PPSLIVASRTFISGLNDTISPFLPIFIILHKFGKPFAFLNFIISAIPCSYITYLPKKTDIISFA
ncbi:MAG: hypothetical protein ACLTLZ_05745, partial [Pseudoruminococcus massiliensis]